MKKILSLLTVSLLLLSSCSIDNDSITLEYNTLENIKEKIDSDLKTPTDNFILPKSIDISGENIITCSSVPFRYDLQGDFLKILSEFYEDSSINAENLLDQGKDVDYLDYIDEINDRRAVVSKRSSGNGNITLPKSARWGIEMSNDMQYPITEVIHIDRFDGDRTLTLSGEEYSLSGAVSCTEKWVTDFWGKYEPEYTYKVKTAVLRPAPEIFDNSGESVTLEMIIEKRLNGVPMDELGQLFGMGKTLLPARIVVKMVKPDDIFYFQNDGFTRSLDIENAKSVEKLITPETAIRLASNYISGAMCVKISCISLKYAIGKGEIFPVWAFEVDKSEKSTERKSIYVNAVTAEISDQMRENI